MSNYKEKESRGVDVKYVIATIAFGILLAILSEIFLKP